MAFIALLYGLGHDSNRGAIWMCYIIQAIFVLCVICMFTIMVVCDDKNALLLLRVFYWLHVYIIIIINKLG
jgi:hypothetical protein